MDLVWVSVNGKNLPVNAIVAGNDIDGKQLYVARACHEGDLVPGKLIQFAQQAHISYGTSEIVKHQYDVLTGTKYTWVACSNGNVPPHAVIGGLTSYGEILYIGRASYNNSVQPGKVHKSHRCMYFPYGDAERNSNHYEVLCNIQEIPPQANVNSVTSNHSAIQQSAIPACQTKTGEKVSIAPGNSVTHKEGY